MTQLKLDYCSQLLRFLYFLFVMKAFEKNDANRYDLTIQKKENPFAKIHITKICNIMIAKFYLITNIRGILWVTSLTTKNESKEKFTDFTSIKQYNIL